MNDIINKLLTLIRGDVVILQNLLPKLFQKQIDETSSLKSEVAKLAKEVKEQKPPVVNVPAPKVEVTVPDVIVPEIKMPEIKAPDIKIPEITIPPITVPKPEVTVNIPPIKFPKPEKPVVNVEPKVEVKIPKEFELQGFKAAIKSLLEAINASQRGEMPYDRDNPLPVILTDKNGEFYKAVMSAVSYGGGGGGSQDPLQPYKIADLDDASNSKYYGFTHKDGYWYILRENTSTKTYRYTAGGADYPTNWTNRATLAYDYFHNIFQ